MQVNGHPSSSLLILEQSSNLLSAILGPLTLKPTSTPPQPGLCSIQEGGGRNGTRMWEGMLQDNPEYLEPQAFAGCTPTPIQKHNGCTTSVSQAAPVFLYSFHCKGSKLT